MIRLACEPWFAIEDSIDELSKLHWREIAVNQEHIALSLDLNFYRMAAKCGSLHVVTVRDEGELVGYYITIVRTHPHYRETLFGFLDSYFVRKDHRTPVLAFDLFEFMEAQLKEIGVKCLLSGVKLHHDAGPIFERLGWKPIETMYTKYIGA